MITFIIGLLIIGGSIGGVVCVTGMMLTGLTPGRRTRGLARWWARCWRWTRTAGASGRVARVEPTGCLPPMPWAVTPTPTEFHAAWSPKEAMLTQEDIRTLNAKFITDGVAAWRRR